MTLDRNQRTKMVVALVFAIQGLGICFFIVTMGFSGPSRIDSASALANNLATNLTAAQNQLNNLAIQAKPLDPSSLTATLKNSFDECDKLVQQLKQERGSKAEDLERQIKQALITGRIALDQFETKTGTLNLALQASSDSASQLKGQISSQQQVINQLIAVIAAQKSSKSNSVLVVVTALVGLLGSISAIILAWRADSRELAKLQIEFKKLRAEANSEKSKKKN